MMITARSCMQVRPLISEIVSPEKARDVYERLITAKNPPLGIVFDWKQYSD